MELRRPKWSPGGPNGAQEAQMEPRRLKWSPGGPNGALEAQMEPRKPKWSPGLLQSLLAYGMFEGSAREGRK